MPVLPAPAVMSGVGLGRVKTRWRGDYQTSMNSTPEATMAWSEFSCPYIIGYGYSPSRCGPSRSRNI